MPFFVEPCCRSVDLRGQLGSRLRLLVWSLLDLSTEGLMEARFSANRGGNQVLIVAGAATDEASGASLDVASKSVSVFGA